MSTLNWKWDDELDEWDPYTLLGRIEIEGKNGKRIVDNCTMIDIWVVPIFEGLESLKNKLETEFDLVDEPNILKFIIKKDKYFISYGDSVIEIVEMDNLLNQLKKICIATINYIKNKSSIINQVAVDRFTHVINNIK